MEIVLLRHGKPESAPTSLITGREIGEFVRQYNALGISKALSPPPTVLAIAASAGCVVSSDLKRSVESAQWLAPDRTIALDPDLREAALPESIDIPLPLPPGAWVVIARVMWWLNLCRAEESIAETRVRAVRAASQLIERARLHTTVLVVGHGVFNRLIGADLVRRGWRGRNMLPRAYLAAARFTF